MNNVEELQTIIRSLVDYFRPLSRTTLILQFVYILNQLFNKLKLISTSNLVVSSFQLNRRIDFPQLFSSPSNGRLCKNLL